MKLKEIKARVLSHITFGKAKHHYKTKAKNLRMRRKQKMYRHLREMFGTSPITTVIDKRDVLIGLVAALRSNHYKGIYIMGSCEMGWFEVFKQRHHHIADYLMQKNFLVICGMNPIYELDKTETICFQSQNLALANFYDRGFLKEVIDTIAKEFDGLKCYHLIGTEPNTSLEELKYLKSLNYKIVYEYFDEISKEIFPNLSDASVRRHQYLLKDKEVLVVATSDNLYQKAIFYRKENVIKSLNGVRLSDWENPTAFVPEEMKEIVKLKHKIVGFYGSFAPWIDFEFIKALAMARPEYEIVMIGYDYEWGKGAFAKSRISELKNVHIIGSQPYAKLKYFARFFDAAMLPFRLTEVTKSVSPVKLFEFMAQGIPMVSTDMQECRKYKVVHIAHNSEEFIKEIDKCIALKQNPKYLSLLRETAAQNTWEERGKQVLNALEHMNEKKATQPVLSIAVPCYNMENFIIRNCLSKLCVPALKDKIEIIVIDDGSADRSVLLVNMYNSLYNGKIKLIKKQNGGHGSCINAGVKAAKGKYFKLVDADDFCDPVALIQHVVYLENTEVDAVVTDYHRFYDNGHRDLISYKDRLSEKKYTIHSFIDAILLDTNFTSYAHMHAITFKSELLKNVKITENSFYVDNEYIIYPLLSVKKIAYQNIALYEYYLGREGQSVDRRVAMERAYQNLNIIHNIQNFLKKVKNKKLFGYILNILYHASIFYIENSTSQKEIEALLRWWKKTDKSYYDLLDKGTIRLVH